MTAVAILGARGQIARSLIVHLPRDWDVQAFSRDPVVPHDEATARGSAILPYDDLLAGEYDVIINAAGPGNPGAHRVLGTGIIDITERFDGLASDYLARHSSAAYINISTGAIHGVERSPYVQAKHDVETKHRCASNKRIADLRVFGYFSRWIDINSQFFLAQAVVHLVSARPFVTSAADFVRDYVSPEDLAAYIVALVDEGVPNGAYDALSAEPVTKFDALDALTEHFGLRYVVDGGTPTRLKRPKSVMTNAPNYPRFSQNSKLSSIQLVLRETEALYRTHERMSVRAVADGCR